MDEYVFDSRWFKNIPPGEVDALKAQLISDKKTLDSLKKILYNIVRSEQDVRFSDYETPSWANKQAHRNGSCEAYHSILRLITLDKDPTNV